ncbi:MAG: MmgE/PrpD family protein [Granulosicoccus sp.]
MARLDNISERIAHFAVATRDEQFPEPALHMVRLSMLDWLAVARAGMDEPVAHVVRSLVAEEGGREEAFAMGLDKRVPARAAALLNGSIGHALDYDDTHFASMGHPSAAVVPAALSIAQRAGSDGRAVQQAVLIGAELAVRVGMWLGRDHYRRGFHITATAGSFGAAMAAVRLLGLTAKQASHALSLAASRAAGVKAQFGSMGKPFHAGLAASNGVEAALLAQKGFQAADATLEGAQGFARSHHGEFNLQAFDTLGDTYIFEKVSHKFHACCHGLHAALEALTDLRDKQGVEPDDIVNMQITVHPQYLDICNITEPASGLQCKFSYTMTAAMLMYRHDTARLDVYNDDICDDVALKELGSRISVEVDATMSETYASVRVTLRNQTTLHASHDLLAIVSATEREEKILNKASGLLSRSDSMRLWDVLNHGGDLPLPKIFNNA